jgi:hypothetical protein
MLWDSIFSETSLFYKIRPNHFALCRAKCHVQELNLFKPLTFLGMLIIMAGLFAPYSAGAEEGNQNFSSQINFSETAFQNIWNRGDLPVSQGTVSRSWLWGNGLALAGNEVGIGRIQKDYIILASFLAFGGGRFGRLLDLQGRYWLI